MPIVPTTAPHARPANFWDRYQPWRRPVEIGYWVVGYAISAATNSATALMDVRRAGLDFAAWEPVVWEWSSSLVMLALVPTLVWFTRRVPLHLDTWRRALPLHLVASVAWSLLHVAGMVALRKLAYTTQGSVYDFGQWPREFGYEYLKDIRSYAGMVTTIEVYRWLLRRLQGEASILAQADDAPPAEAGSVEAVVDRPERFLVRKLGKEFLVAASDVEWLQAAGQLREPARARPRLPAARDDGIDRAAVRPGPLRPRAPQLHGQPRLHRRDRTARYGRRADRHARWQHHSLQPSPSRRIAAGARRLGSAAAVAAELRGVECTHSALSRSRPVARPVPARPSSRHRRA